MKKLRQLVATLMLVFAFGTTVMAEPKTESYKEVGVDITLPDEITNAAGYFEGSAMGTIDSDHHVYALCFIYLGSDKDVVAQAIANPDSFSEEELEKLGETETIMTAVFAPMKKPMLCSPRKTISSLFRSITSIWGFRYCSVPPGFSD